ncbi:Polyketide synthase dehydratase [Popillia japonica]|uniref:Polyketide synthase dehydratase n=1 Tax=Popillia japonica TaxID=7064 RepID=A0AAW1LQ76_POPJA
MKSNKCCNDPSERYTDSAESDTVVIAGMSGKFAAADNTFQYYEGLSNKVNLVTGDFGKLQNHPELPKWTGKINTLDKFDLGFFGVTSRQSHNMDPSIRLLLERVLEAINSITARTGIGGYYRWRALEIERAVYFEEVSHFCDSMTGTGRSLMAKRISYHFKLKGPSYQLDAACCGSLCALEDAYISIRQGKCDRAIVVAANLCLHPSTSMDLVRLGVTCSDGKSKSFDNSVDGYARSEAAVVLLLDKSRNAKRIYAEIVNIKTNCDGYKIEGITFPKMVEKKNIMLDVYNECNIDRRTTSFVEAHGTGTAIGDREELNNIDEVFCEGRKDPLYIGAVKSNLGHTEAASGLCSIVKIILSMKSGFILPNINYCTPLRGVEGLEKRRLAVVTEKVPLSDHQQLFAICNYGFGGSNAIALLRPYNNSRPRQQVANSILPQLICVSGRIKEGVDEILDDFSRQGCNIEHAYLLHQAFSLPHDNHIYRGFALYNKFGEVTRSCKRLEFGDQKLLVIFDNFEQRWCSVGNHLLSIPIFSRTIHYIRDNPESSPLSKQIATAVSVQISLVEVLRTIELTPYEIVGIGYGEVAASYMKNMFSLNDTVHNLLQVITDLNKNGSKQHNMLNTLSTYQDLCVRENKMKQYASFYENNMHNPDKFHLLIGTGPNVNVQETLFLVDDNSENHVESLLINLGRLYEVGNNLKIDKLYPTIQLPVSRTTPMLSSLVRWDHRKKCKVYPFHVGTRKPYIVETVKISTKNKDWSFIPDHIIDEKNIFPASGYIFLVVECLANALYKSIDSLRIIFEDIEFLKEVIMPTDEHLELMIHLHIVTKTFEVTKGTDLIVKGKVYEQIEHYLDAELLRAIDDNKLCMNNDDIYQELRLRGYQYNNDFKGISGCSLDIAQAKIEWKNNWICCIDNILQIYLLRLDTKDLHVPSSIQQLELNIPKHLNQTKISNNCISVELYNDTGIIRTPGIEIRGYHTKTIEKSKPEDSVLEVVKFIANETQLDSENSIRSLVQLILENVNGINVDIIEIYDGDKENQQFLHVLMTKAIDELPLMQSQVTVLENNISEPLNSLLQDKIKSIKTNCLVVVATKLLEIQKKLQELQCINCKNTFFISREPLKRSLSEINHRDLNILCTYTTENETLILFRQNTNTFFIRNQSQRFKYFVHLHYRK